jgi:hemerythrin
MERIGYPDLEAHRRQHHTLRAKVRAMQGRSAAGEVTMTIEVAHFLIQWLKQHTIASDRLIAERLNARNLPA